MLRFSAARLTLRPALIALILPITLSKGLAEGGLLNATDWQLFIDDYAVARGTGLDRIVHHPRAMGVVIPADKPWESLGIAPSHFFKKPDGTFIGFYSAIWGDSTPGGKIQPDRSQQYVVASAYATSRDGIHWTKPNLGLMDAPTGIDWQTNPPFPSPKGASKENNLGVPFDISDLGQYGNVSDPARRYLVSADGQSYAATEIPDFVHDPEWKSKLNKWPMTSPTRAAVNFWDKQHDEWVGMAQSATPHWLPTRTIARFASKDLSAWTSEMVLAPDSLDSHTPSSYDEPMGLYAFHSDGIVFGLLSWFHSDRTTPDGGPVVEGKSASAQGWPWPKSAEHPFVWPWARKGTNEMRITISRDGAHSWDRTSSREAWIAHGTEQDSYDRMVIFPTLPIRVGDEDWFYMGVFNGDHLTSRSDARQRPFYSDRVRTGEIALYVQKHNRYVSLTTGSQIETLITKPFVIDGDTLQLNVDASRGKVRVGIAEYKPVATPARKSQDGGAVRSTPSTDPYLMEQNALPGFAMTDCRPIEANGIEQVVEFRDGSSLKSIRGRTVVLFVEMLDSDLYGFRLL
jgi:hypothetical protein